MASTLVISWCKPHLYLWKLKDSLLIQDFSYDDLFYSGGRSSDCRRLWKTAWSILGVNTWEKSILVLLQTLGSSLFHCHLLTSKPPTFSSISASRLLFSIDFAAGCFQAQTTEHGEALSSNPSEGFAATDSLDLRKTITIAAHIIRDLLCCTAEALSILLNPHHHYHHLLIHVAMNAYRWGVTSLEPLKLVAEFELMLSADLRRFRTLKIFWNCLHLAQTGMFSGKNKHLDL